MIRNFFSMPFLMRLLVSLGIVSPAIILFSLLNASRDSFYDGVTIIKILFVIIFGLTLFFSSLRMVHRGKNSRAIYVSCLAFISGTRFFFSQENISMLFFLKNASFDIFMIFLIALYLYLNSNVRDYFNNDGF